MNDISCLAPVIITTLNRYEHFKVCLESLEKCTWAEYTDIYVALDFPPSEKYKIGWEKISKFLDYKKENNIFHNLYVIKREYNYGIGHINSNGNSLIHEIKNKYDRYILSEDDNIFSPNFLVYLNKGLEKFKDDDRICCVCGYNYPMEFPDNYKNNYYITKHGSPWGYGTWFSRQKDFDRYYDLNYLKNLLKDEESFKKLKKYRPSAIGSILNMIKNDDIYGDTAKGCYIILEDKYWICPVISKVKNIGDDGSGAHATRKNKQLLKFYSEQIVDKEKEFEFTDDIFTYEPVLLNRYSAPISKLRELYKGLVTRIDLFLFRNFNYIPKSKYI